MPQPMAAAKPEQEQPEEQTVQTIPLHSTQPEATQHAWRQRGNRLYCLSCPFRHESILPQGVHLVGIDAAGNPMLEDRRKP